MNHRFTTLVLAVALCTAAVEVQGRPRALPRQAPMRHAAPVGQVGPAAAISEAEHNDTIGWADALPAQTLLDASIPNAFDRDVFRIVLGADALLTASVIAGAAPALDDPDLQVLDVNGVLVAYNQDQSAASKYPLVVAQLPAGVYYLAVEAPNAVTFGGYRISFSATSLNVPLVQAGIVTNATLPVGSDLLYRLLVPADSRIDVSVTGTPLDMNLTVRTQTGALYRFVEDSGASMEPALNTYLPAGIYLLAFSEFNHFYGAFTFKVDVTSATLPPAPCGTQLTRTIAGDETLDFFKVTVAAFSRVRFQTSATATTPMSDTIVRIRDAKLNEISFNDENGASSFSLLDVPLPVGTYYLTIEGWLNDKGGYLLTGTCGLTFQTQPLVFGRNAISVPIAGESAAFTFGIGTPNPIELEVDTSQSTLPDAHIAVVDQNGLVRLSCDNARGLLDPLAGVVLEDDPYLLIVREYYNISGTLDLHLRPPMFFQDASSANRTLANFDKATNGVYLFLGIAPIALPFQMPQPISGFLLIDPTVLVALASQVTPAQGVFTWPFNFAQYPIVLQAVSVDAALSAGVMSDLVK